MADTDDLIGSRPGERSGPVDIDVAGTEVVRRRERPRRRSRLVAAVAGIALVGGSVAVGLALRSDETRATIDTGPAVTAAPDRPVTAPDTWRELPPGPLSARSGASAVWTGTEVLIAGGSDAPPCGPTEQCLYVEGRLGDGAAYDPATDAWRPIADAPFPFMARHALWTGDVMLVLASEGVEGTRVVAYDPALDEWAEGTSAPAEAVNLRTAFWTGDVVVFGTGDNQQGARDWTYDPAADRWALLPVDPLGCAYDRYLAGAGEQLVLFAVACTPNPGSDGPPLYRAAAYDLRTREWRRLADSEVLGGSSTWFAVGDQLVNPSGGHHTGGVVNPWDRPYPLGGILDLATNTWAELPQPPPTQPAPGTSALTGTVRSSIAYGGQLFTPATGTWDTIPAGPHRSNWSGTSVWTGHELIVWGGIDDTFDSKLASGAAYTPPE